MCLCVCACMHLCMCVSTCNRLCAWDIVVNTMWWSTTYGFQFIMAGRVVILGMGVLAFQCIYSLLFLQQSVHSTGHCSCSFFYTAVVYCLTHSICHFYNLQGLHCVLSSLMPCTVGAECCVWQVFVRLKDLKGQKCVQSFRPKDYLEACVRVRVRVCV